MEDNEYGNSISEVHPDSRDASCNYLNVVHCGHAPRHTETDPPRATHDGASWSTAYALLDDALAVADSGDEVWVAAGEYWPDDILLPVGMKLYGGFAGTETVRSQRDCRQYVALLHTTIFWVIDDTEGLCVVDRIYH